MPSGILLEPMWPGDEKHLTTAVVYFQWMEETLGPAPQSLLYYLKAEGVEKTLLLSYITWPFKTHGGGATGGGLSKR